MTCSIAFFVLNNFYIRIHSFYLNLVPPENILFPIPIKCTPMSLKGEEPTRNFQQHVQLFLLFFYCLYSLF